MPSSKTSTEVPPKKSDTWLGIALIATSLIVLLLTRSIHAIGLGDNFDPGPKAFPIGLSVLLALGGIIELWQSLRNQPALPPVHRSPGEVGSSETEKETLASRPVSIAPSSNHRTVLILLSCFLVYVLMVPWLGFALSTLIMATVMMVLLGNSWKLSVIVSVILITIIYFLFVMLFKVPLPGGVLGMPF